MVSGGGLRRHERPATSNEKAPPSLTPRSSYTFLSDLWLKSPELPVRPHPGNSLMRKGERERERPGQSPLARGQGGQVGLPLLPCSRQSRATCQGDWPESLPQDTPSSPGPGHMRAPGRLASTLRDSSALCWPLAASESGPGIVLLAPLWWPGHMGAQGTHGDQPEWLQKAGSGWPPAGCGQNTSPAAEK